MAIGIPCVTAAADVVQQLQSHLNEHPGTSVQINLDQMTVTWGDVSHPIHMGEGPRQMMLSGTWDACGQLLGQVKQIEATTKRLPYLAWS